MSRRIFRESALQRYNERLEKIELPRYASAPWALIMWLGAFLLLFFTALLLAVEVPTYATGPGIVLQTETTGGAEPGAVVAALLPAEFAAQLSAGQAAEITLPTNLGGEESGELRAIVLDVEPEPLSPAAARARYGLDAATGSQINGPVAVAFIGVDIPSELWLGSVGEARIRLGSRSILSRLPTLLLGEAGVGGGE